MTRAIHLAIAAVIGMASISPSAAGERAKNLPADAMQDFDDPQVRVCPNGIYEGGCDRGNIMDAVMTGDEVSADLGTTCLFQTKARCTPTAHGYIPASKFSGLIAWQHMEIYPDDGPRIEMLVITETESDRLTNIIAARQTEGWFGVPDVIENSDRLLMIHAPGRSGGTGAGNVDIVMTRHQMGWTTFDVNVYLEQASHLLPEGFELGRGANFNFREMHASVPVKRPHDGGCCATGGFAHIDLGLPRANWMQVDSITFEEMSPVNTHRIAATENLMEYEDESTGEK